MTDFRKRINNPLLPSDATPEEYMILQQAILNIYNALDDPTDKFLVAFVNELNYTQEMAAEAVGKSNKWVSVRMEKIREKLRVKYRIRK